MLGRRVLLPFICLVAVLALVACGGDDDSEGSSVEGFIAEADEVCVQATLDALAGPPVPTTEEERVPYLEASVERREQTQADFEALGDPPAEIAEEWESVLAGDEQRLSNTRENLELAQQGVSAEEPRYQRLVAESSEIDEEQNATLAELGSTACAEVLPPDVEEEIIERVTTFETEALEDCTEYLTDDGIEQAFGSLEKCQRAQENPPPEGFTQAVNVTQVEGVEEVRASVDASLEGGFLDGDKVTYNVVFEDGVYKVNSITQQAG